MLAYTRPPNNKVGTVGGTSKAGTTVARTLSSLNSLLPFRLLHTDGLEPCSSRLRTCNGLGCDRLLKASHKLDLHNSGFILGAARQPW